MRHIHALLLIFAALAPIAAVDGSEPVAPHRMRIEAGQPFSWAPRFTGWPTRFRAEGLPPGLVVDPRSGAVGGVPTAAGTYSATIFAANSKGVGTSHLVLEVVGAARSAPPPPPAGGGAEEEDTPDPSLAAKVPLRDWTDMQRRTAINCLLPAAATLGAGQWYYRVSHVAQEAWYQDHKTNLVGLDDSVKIGLMVAYGFTDRLDLYLQRVNGYDLSVAPRSPSEPSRFDYYDLLAKYRLCSQRERHGGGDGLADVALIAGTTYMWRNSGSSDKSLDAELMLERDLLDDRVRLGIGIAHAGLSTYEATQRLGPPRKILPSEYDYLSSQGAQPKQRDPASTTAVPVTCKIAITRRWALLGEAIFPVAGYDTGQGPSLAGGFRLNTATHEFSFYLTNTANVAFNSVLTGGNSRNNLNLFAFSISAYF